MTRELPYKHSGDEVDERQEEEECERERESMRMRMRVRVCMREREREKREIRNFVDGTRRWCVRRLCERHYRTLGTVVTNCNCML